VEWRGALKEAEREGKFNKKNRLKASKIVEESWE
jgi:hypothetical protein